MGSFANLSANLNLNIQNFSNQLKVASRQMNSFAASMNGRTVESMKELNKQTNAWGLNMKSVSRVVSGILISQSFYGIVQQIRSAVDAVWEFTKQLEYAQIAYSNLFGDTSLALEFINVLKDFAAKTPFTFTEAEKSAKRLIAYGIDYSNVMYVMQGVMAAASAQGDPTKIEQISRAIGQVYTYGKLMTAEVRQLTEAGIPVFDILQEKLGLTQDQLRNLGHEAVPASVAINALIDGINERFGGVVNASSLTITGIISNIKDNATMLFSGLFQPLTVWIKSALKALGDFLFAMRDIMELKGIGGVFEAIFPKELHGELRLFAANIITLFQAVMRLGMAIGSVLSPVAQALMRVFNAFSPVLITVANALAAIIQYVTSNATAMRWLTAALAAAAAMWVVFKVRALAAAVVAGVVTLISKALAGLSAMLTFVMAHPFWALLIGLAGILVGVSGGFGKISDGISNIFKNLTKLNGIDSDKILLPEIKDRNNDLDKFNERLDTTNDALNEAGDAAEGAGGKADKARRGLLAFDEVFKLNENTSEDGSGAGNFEYDPDLEGLADLASGLGDAYIPEIPDFGNYMEELKTGFVDSFKDAWENIKKTISNMGLGALIGSILGGILGGPLGAKIGAIVGAIAGLFWDKLAEALGLTDVGKVALPIATGLGAIIGGLIGGPVGALVGGAIGTLVGWIIDAIARGFETGDWSHLATPLGVGIGAAIGMIFGGPLGAAIGAAIGGLVGWITDLLIDNWDSVSSFFGNIGDLVISAFDGVAPVVGKVFGDISTTIGTAVKVITSGVSNTWSGMLKTVGTVMGDLFGNITTVFSDIFKAVSTVHEDIRKAVFTVWETVTKAIATFLKDIFTAVDTVWTDIKNAIGTVLTDIFKSVSKIWQDVFNAVKTVNDSIRNVITQVWQLIFDLIAKVLTNIFDKISSVFEAARDKIDKVFTVMLNIVNATLHSMYKVIQEKFNGFYTTISTKVSDAYEAVKKYFSEMFNAITTRVSNIYTSVKKVFGDIYTSIKNSVADMYNSVSEGIGKIYQVFTNWISNLWNNVFGKFFNWIDNGISKLREFFGLESRSSSISSNYSGASFAGHATGGIFDREHIARFAEDNKKEAIIPLEYESAMQPFVDAVSNGLTSSLAPLLANVNGSGGQSGNQLPPLYVGTLIADDRGLKELYKKFEIIQIQENARRVLV